MAQRTGALVFDERTDRYDIRFDLNTYYIRVCNYATDSCKWFVYWICSKLADMKRHIAHLHIPTCLLMNFQIL